MRIHERPPQVVRLTTDHTKRETNAVQVVKHVQITPTRLQLSSLKTTTLMAYVQVEADDVRICTISSVLL